MNTLRPFNQRIDWYYNIVLDQTNQQPEQAHSVIIENIECITMGHNISVFNEQNRILEHLYFGTNQVTHDLERFIAQNQTNNIITVENYVIIRGNDSLVCSIAKL